MKSPLAQFAYVLVPLALGGLLHYAGVGPTVLMGTPLYALIFYAVFAVAIVAIVAKAVRDNL